MIQLFINNEQVIAYGIQIMRVMIIALPFAGIQFLIRVTFQALGKGKPALILALARDLIYIPTILILDKYFGFSGFLYANPISNITILLLAIFLFYLIKGQIYNEHMEWKMNNSDLAVEVINPVE